MHLRTLALWCSLALLAFGRQGYAAEVIAYVGTYTGGGSDGIYAWRFDPATGQAEPLGLAAATDNPSWLAADSEGRYLYAANEVDTFGGEPTGAISVFAIDRRSGALTPVQQVSSLGAGPAHLSLTSSGQHLLVANYNGGNVAVFPIGADGRLGAATAFVQDVGSSVNPERQAGPHAHFIETTRDDRFALVADLGLDQVLVHRFDAETGSLAPGTPPFVAVEPGAGPRQVAFAPSGKTVYLVNELTSQVTALTYKARTGTLQPTHTLSTLPEGFTGTNTAAEIELDDSGRFLYVSNRGADTIATFAVDPKGRLTLVGSVPSGGVGPRHFAIDPTGAWLLAAHQGSNSVDLLRLGEGLPVPTGGSFSVVSPVCVHFVTLEEPHEQPEP